MSQPFLDGYSQPQCLKALMIPWSVLAVETKSAMALRSSIAFPIAVAWSTASSRWRSFGPSPKP